MAKIKDTQTEVMPQKASTFDPYSGGIHATGTITPPTYIVFKLVHKKRGGVRVDGRCDNVPNPNRGGKKERVHLLNGADSIWQSDLIELLKDKSYVNKNYRSLEFYDGVCRVQREDDRMLEYARVNTHNVGRNRRGAGPLDYYEYDRAAEEAENMKSQARKIETVLKVSNMDEEPMRMLASFLGIPFVDDLGMPKSPNGIRSELLLRTDNDPETTLKYFGSPEIEIAWIVKKAIIEGRIDLGGVDGNAVWSSGGGLICKIPAGRKAYQHLTELAMTNSEAGRKFKEQLQQT